MDYYALISIIDVVVKLLIVIVLPCLSYDKLFVYGLLSFVLSLINFLLFYIYSNRNFVEVKLRFEFDRELFKTMLSFSGWNMLGAIAYTIQGQGLNVLVNSFFGPVVNAARAIAFQIHAAISGFSENISTAFKPQLIEIYAMCIRIMAGCHLNKHLKNMQKQNHKKENRNESLYQQQTL